MTRGHGAALAADRARSSISKGSLPPVLPGRVAADDGDVECHTMRRGQMRIERHALRPADGARNDAARSGRHARRRSHPDSTARRSTAPPARSTASPWTSAPRRSSLRLIDLETGELVADTSFENPQRFGGSDVMSRIHYDTEHPRQAADAHARRLSDPRDRGLPRGSADRFTKWSSSATRRCAICSSARASTRSARTRTARSPRSKWRRASATTTSLTTTGRRSPAADPSEGARLRRADHQRPRRRRRGGVHAGGRSRARGAARRDHGHRHQHRADRRQRHRILAASCPAGPGVRRRRDRLRHAGARRRDRRRRASTTTATFRLGVIGGGAPEGICGSGLVDLMSELLRTGRMNAMGRFEDRARPHHARCRRTTSISSKAT